MPDFNAYAPGLHSGAQPTPDDLAQLRDIGVRSVINLRAPTEDSGYDEAAEAARLGMDYATLAVGGSDDLTAETVTRFGVLLDAGRARGDVLVHCASGNRVGALVALHAAAHGVLSADALALGRAAGLAGLEPAVVDRLRATP